VARFALLLSIVLAVQLLFITVPLRVMAQKMDTASGKNGLSLTQAEASHFAQLALKCVNKELPNKPDHVINDQNDIKSPRVLHPAFYGCYDWHSSVHGHWMLVRLLRLFPELPEAQQIRSALNANLSPENITGEVAYLVFIGGTQSATDSQ